MFCTILFVSLFSFFLSYAHDDIQVVFEIDDNQIKTEALYQEFPEVIYVDKVSYSSDSLLQQQEFFYLTSLHDNTDIKVDDIACAIYFLSKKNIFSAITVSLYCRDGIVTLHFYLQSAWTFSKIKIHGILRGSDEYVRLYSLEAGDQFDEIKHAHSCKNIRNYLSHEGYHSVRIDDKCIYNEKTKTVEVHISIARGKRYRISDASVILKDVCKDVHLEKLKHELQKKIRRGLAGKWYARDELKHVTSECKTHILHEGFLSSDIVLEQSFDHTHKKVLLTFFIDVSHKLRLFFIGNTFFSQGMLLDRIVQFGKSIWLLPSSLLEEEIERMYRDKGFWDVSVTSKQEDDIITFTIHEGRRAKIDHIRLTNQENSDELKLLRRYFRDIVHGYVDVQKIDSALYNFVGNYIKEGYICSQVIDYSYEHLSDNRYALIVAFDKGKQTFVDDVSIIGLDDKNVISLFNDNNVQVGSPLTSDMISFGRARLTDYCQDSGYMYAQVSPQIITQEDFTTLQWNVKTGPKVFFGKTIITGSPEFSFDRIMKRLSFCEGDLWDHELVHRSLQTLKDMSVFDVVQLYPDQTYQSSERVLLLRLQHDDPFEFRLRGGFELEHIKDYQTFGGVTYKVGGTAMIKNPFKIGDIFRFDADVSGSHREITAHYLFPIETIGISTGKLQGYHILFEHPGFIGSKKNIYTVQQNGFLFGLQKKVFYSDIGCNIGVEWQQTAINDIDRMKALADAIDFNSNTLDRQVPYLFFEPTLYIDVLDNNLFPHKGLYTLFSLKGMVPLKQKGASELFLKLHVEQSFFVPIYSAVLGVRFRFGHIFYENFSGINPIERFYLGGSHSVRGYEGDLVPPLSQFIEDDHICLIPRGGKSMINANIEMRFSIFENIGAVIFHDSGVLSAANFSEQNSFIAHASGFGVRFHTPLGPLRFDIGFKWNRLFEQEERYAWYVTFGHAF